MTDTTTIEITTEQKRELDRRKANGDYDSYKAVLTDLLESGDTNQVGIDEATAREIAQEVVNEMVSYKALQ